MKKKENFRNFVFIIYLIKRNFSSISKSILKVEALRIS